MSRRRVLLVEDDPKTREVVELYLRREGHAAAEEVGRNLGRLLGVPAEG